MSQCEMTLLVQADFDGELDTAQAASLQSHMVNCPDCQAALHILEQAREQTAKATRYRVPEALRLALTAPVTAPTPTATVIPMDAHRPRRRLWSQVPSFAAGLAVAAALALMVVPKQHDGTLVDSVVSSHVRALQPGHLIDVASTDQHTVKPWFDGRIDFAPSVRNLAAQGFPLIGGRMDYLDDRPVAALIYQRDKHLIDLYVWPESKQDMLAPMQTSRNGYNVEHWGKDGMTYWAVSDLNAAELAQFHEMWKTGG